MRAKSEKCTKGIIGRFQSVLVALCMLLVCSFTVAAQTQVSGVVTDESGDPLAGVTILVKGSSVGTSTNIDGEYAINAPEGATLTFTYVGMAPSNHKLASGQTKLNVVMKEDATNLDEVVVVGYGQQKKLTMTGAVSQVTSKDITKTVGTNLSQSLVGKLPGMITQQGSGRPGNDGVSILVRGYSSYNDAGTVMVIIDGVERGSNGLSAIDPNEVESISVLKDAASCAIYGMKAANGVIIITTKRGQQGKATINYRGTVTLNQPTGLPKMMNGLQYMQWYNLAQSLDTQITGNPYVPHFTQDMMDAVNNGDITDGIEDTDWTSTLKKTTLNTQHNLTISGGSDKAHYFLSGGFMKQNGTLKNQSYQRGNFRSNVDAEVADMFDLQFSAAGIVADSHYPSGQTYATTNGAYSLENMMLYSAPYIPKVYINGSNPDDPNNGMPTSAFRSTGHNPEYAAGHSGFMESRRVTINTSGRVDWKAPFLKGLKASFFFSWDWWDIQSKTFAYGYRVMSWNPSSKTYANLLAPNLMEQGNMNVGDQKQQQVVIRPSISYDGKFGKHAVSALFLYEQTKIKSSAMSSNRQNFELFDLPYLSFGQELPAAINSANSESAGRSASEGFAGRVSYNYDEKYLAEVAFRYDGSYLFAPGKRWGFFPSVSAGWVISREDWFKEWTDKVDFLKIRGSIGKTGNDNVTAWLYRQQYVSSLGIAAFGTTPTTGTTLSPKNVYLQDNLTWEKTNSYDIGFELTMWNGLLGVEFDYFYKYTYDILTGVGSAFAPSLAGNYPSIDNKGTFDNRGIELVLRHTNRIGNVSYNVNANVTWAHNRILSQTESAGVLPWQSRLGSSIGDVWGFKTAGLYQTQEQLDNMPKPVGNQPVLGDIMYVDINGDGKITAEDQVKIGRNQRPEMMFALNAEASWNGFDLSFQFQGAALADRFLGAAGTSDLSPLCRPWYANWDNAPLYLVEGAWRPDNPNAEYPRLSLQPSAQNGHRSDFWKRNASYLRLKNLTIGYTIPTKLTKKAGMSNVRFFASGVNLFTVTDFKYLDPEGGNWTWAFYPQQRTFTFGLDLSF
ncbi:MAG: TonB-dependent receptor [Muribaculaceae bacterium]|nr:TonB-dependent receptor [Muribaculaceae bacterium]